MVVSVVVSVLVSVLVCCDRYQFKSSNLVETCDRDAVGVEADCSLAHCITVKAAGHPHNHTHPHNDSCRPYSHTRIHHHTLHPSLLNTHTHKIHTHTKRTIPPHRPRLKSLRIIIVPRPLIRTGGHRRRRHHGYPRYYYTLYSPFIHLHYHINTYVHPLYMYIHHI